MNIMPHLQLEINVPILSEERLGLSKWVVSEYCSVFEASSEEMAVTICDYSTDQMYLGGVHHPQKGIAFINIDIFSTADEEGKRNLSESLMKGLNERLDIPVSSIYVIFREISQKNLYRFEPDRVISEPDKVK